MKTVKVKFVQNLKSLGIRVYEDKDGIEYFEHYKSLPLKDPAKIYNKIPDDLDASELKVNLIKIEDIDKF